MPACADTGTTTANSDFAAMLRTIMVDDPRRWRALGAVRSLRLPDCWIGAGFVRNAVWDRLHGDACALDASDVDVIWFDPMRADAAIDRMLEAPLRRLQPKLEWSVKNQARMHRRNCDAGYISSLDALRHWPETATAVAVRRNAADGCEIAAPYGLDDLFALVLRPTPYFQGDRHAVFRHRVRTKGWLARWHRLRMASLCENGYTEPAVGKHCNPLPTRP
jgi:uncharacterized protein